MNVFKIQKVSSSNSEYKIEHPQRQRTGKQQTFSQKKIGKFLSESYLILGSGYLLKRIQKLSLFGLQCFIIGNFMDEIKMK